MGGGVISMMGDGSTIGKVCYIWSTHPRNGWGDSNGGNASNCDNNYWYILALPGRYQRW